MQAGLTTPKCPANRNGAAYRRRHLHTSRYSESEHSDFQGVAAPRNTTEAVITALHTCSHGDNEQPGFISTYLLALRWPTDKWHATGWSDSYIHWQAIPGPLSLRPIQGTGNDYPLKNRNGVEPISSAPTTFEQTSRWNCKSNSGALSAHTSMLIAHISG